MKALEKDNHRRWQTAADFRTALEATQLKDAAHQFLPSTIANAPPASNRPSPSVANRLSAHQPEVLHEIAIRLASHVGPIANILVKRASSSTNDIRELCELVAKEIESPDARKSFLTSVKGHLRTSGHF
jgi:serine/threonine-protein kinase